MNNFRHLSPSRAGFLVFLSFLGGVLIASFGVVSIVVVWITFLTGVITGMYALLRRSVAVLSLVLLAFAGGLFRMDEALAAIRTSVDTSHFSQSFFAKVAERPEMRGRAMQLVVEADDGKGRSAKLLVYTDRFLEVRRGDTLSVEGKVEPISAFGSAEYQESLARKGIRGTLSFPLVSLYHRERFSLAGALDGASDAFRAAIAHSLKEPGASFAQGILLGGRSGLSEELREAFSRTGTSHIIALSGFNITIIAVAISWFLGIWHVSRRTSLVVSACAVALFVIMVGGGASVVRAAVMGILLLVARERGRAFEMTNALLFAAVIMVLQDPFILRFDLSFQLSFLATSGIMIIPPLIERYASFIPLKFGLREMLLATLAAEMFVMPRIIWQFGTASLIAPLANLMVLPLIPFTMLGAFIVGVVGLVSPAVALPFAWITHLIISYELGIITFLSDIPGASVALPQWSAWFFALVPALFALKYVRRRMTHVSMA